MYNKQKYINLSPSNLVPFLIFLNDLNSRFNYHVGVEVILRKVCDCDSFTSKPNEHADIFREKSTF